MNGNDLVEVLMPIQMIPILLLEAPPLLLSELMSKTPRPTTRPIPERFSDTKQVVLAGCQFQSVHEQWQVYQSVIRAKPGDTYTPLPIYFY